MDNEFFMKLPFYSNIPTSKDMAGLLQDTVVKGRENSYDALLLVSSCGILTLRAR